MHAYLAGPEVFLPDAIEIGQRKKDLCAEFGITGHFPFDNQIDLDAPNVSKLIFDANVEMIRQADIVICNLTPFPWGSPSADAGTIWELGFAYGLGKPCYGYTMDRSPFEVRSRAYLFNMGQTEQTLIETFGNRDNLMIDESLLRFDDPCVGGFDTSNPAIYRNMSTLRYLLHKLTGAPLP